MAWDGTPYAGWQQQPNASTVQGQLVAAMRQLWPNKLQQHAIFAPVAAGRTDAGVHAEAMPIHWDLPVNFPLSCQRLPRALQRFLPSSISLLACQSAPSGFHARFSCHERRYIYRLWVAPQPHALLVGRVLHWPYGSLDQVAMQQAANLLVGKHDFAAFASQEDRQTVRELYKVRLTASTAMYGGQLWEIHVHGESFLRHMVRGLVGTLLLVGGGKLAAEQIPDIVASKQRAKAGMNVASEGLYFAGASYSVL